MTTLSSSSVRLFIGNFFMPVSVISARLRVSWKDWMLSGKQNYYKFQRLRYALLRVSRDLYSTKPVLCTVITLSIYRNANAFFLSLNHQPVHGTLPSVCSFGCLTMKRLRSVEWETIRHEYWIGRDVEGSSLSLVLAIPTNPPNDIKKISEAKIRTSTSWLRANRVTIKPTRNEFLGICEFSNIVHRQTYGVFLWKNSMVIFIT
jgi:hypothetical protein